MSLPHPTPARWRWPRRSLHGASDQSFEVSTRETDRERPVLDMKMVPLCERASRLETVVLIGVVMVVRDSRSRSRGGWTR
jgi:hypothetical protein